MFRTDGINLLKKYNQEYYFENDNPVIPYFKQEQYYELQKKLKNLSLPNFYKTDILKLVPQENYDVLCIENF
jgi:hypothetical protein